jgi:hypothetical protein
MGDTTRTHCFNPVSFPNAAYVSTEVHAELRNLDTFFQNFTSEFA